MKGTIRIDQAKEKIEAQLLRENTP